jgi:hypothetical protein
MRFTLIVSLFVSAFTSAAQTPTRGRLGSSISLTGMTPTQVLQIEGKPFSQDIVLRGGRPFRRWIYKGITFDTGRQILERPVVDYEIYFESGRVLFIERHAHN